MKPTDTQHDISQGLKHIWIPKMYQTCLWQILILTINLSRNFHFPHFSTYINHSQDYPQCLTVTDSSRYKFGRKVVPEKQHESVTQIHSTGMKQKGNFIGRNTINLTKIFTEYCDKCSLHGLKYVGDLQLHPLER